MAVSPIEITTDGIVVRHDEREHGGVTPWAAVRFGTRMVGGRGEDDRAVLVLPCPVEGCGSETAHPLGDAAPDLVRAVAAGLGTRVPEGPRPQTAAEQADAAARALVAQAAQSAVGQNLTALTQAQRNALMAVLLYKTGGLDGGGVVLPLAQWAQR